MRINTIHFTLSPSLQKLCLTFIAHQLTLYNKVDWPPLTAGTFLTETIFSRLRIYTLDWFYLSHEAHSQSIKIRYLHQTLHQELFRVLTIHAPCLNGPHSETMQLIVDSAIPLSSKWVWAQWMLSVVIITLSMDHF